MAERRERDARAVLEAAKRERAMHLRRLSDFALAGECEYAERRLVETIHAVNAGEVPDGLDWVLWDHERELSLLRDEVRRRAGLGLAVDEGGKTLGRFAQDLKAKVVLWEFLGEFYPATNLRRSGDHMKGLCAFHPDHRDPNLHVWDNRFHCFACQEHGDVFDWLTGHGESWIDAVRMVARYAGVAMPAPKARPSISEARRLREAMGA